MNEENTTITVPRYLLRTLTTKGYFSRFYDVVSASGLSHTAAYETIEDERERFELPPGYDNYHSFRSAKSRFFAKSRLIRIEY